MGHFFVSFFPGMILADAMLVPFQVGILLAYKKPGIVLACPGDLARFLQRKNLARFLQGRRVGMILAGEKG